MTTPLNRGGASISARDCTPSIDLVPICDQLAKSVSDVAAQSGEFLSLDGGKLAINVNAVTSHFIKNPKFSEQFSPAGASALLRDITLPPPGTVARLGGRLISGSEPTASKSIERLHDSISSALDATFKSGAYTSLLAPSVKSVLNEMASSIGEKSLALSDSATLVPVIFAPSQRNANERTSDLARLFTAIEIIDGRDWLEALLSGISTRLKTRGVDPSEIEDIVESIRTTRNQPGSQIRRFLDFLDDEALSRVRLQVTKQLMIAIAAQSKYEGFKDYVRRVIDAYELFAGPNGETLTLDVASAYGQLNNSALGDYLNMATFYSCLPVWSEWSVQLFETRTEPTRGFKTMREVSYRFRVNGMNPQQGCSAFDARLKRISDRVLETPSTQVSGKRSIAELMFLWLVTPDSLHTTKAKDLVSSATEVAADLKADPVGTLQRLHQELQARSSVIDDLASELISILKAKSKTIIETAERTADRFTISLSRSIVNWEAVESAASADYLVKAERREDSVEWFNHLTVSASTSPSGGIASYAVEIQIQERSLAANGPRNIIPMSRDLNHPLLPVRLIPSRQIKASGQWVYDVPDSSVFETSCGIDICYAPRHLALSRNDNNDGNKPKEHLRAASLVAFALVTYITLWELIRRLKSMTTKPLTMTMVRLQHTGKQIDREADANDGNTAVYSISQALEKALSRELPVKLQGLTTSVSDVDTTGRWKKRGALHALMGSQTLHFPMAGTLDRVALITYVTRPTDMHPSYPDADGYMFVSRTYTALQQDGVAVMQFDSMSTRLVDNRKEFKTPPSILEEIARLQTKGFEHIILLSHHFGNRHIGRAAERHSPHGTLEFLDDATQRFPSIHLYPLRRDVFPATRLRKRDNSESGFEVTSFTDHQAMFDNISHDVLRSLMPIYTFATLAVVGEEHRPQSGFCTYFFDIEQRVSDLGRKEDIRQNILGIGNGQGVNQSLISVLRALHFMESEKPSNRENLLPVLDPFDWTTPNTTASAGEIPIITRRQGKRSVLLSFPAVLAHVTSVLHKES
ncbi:MAG: hypothetical protein M0R33_16300 [Methylomonas sp.]|jgi:hypothetical protein|uniref:hypothetical protein n=1 Tax=Methylomonas sp. TaxID=418 RepID=UPI0025D58B12|nr:hypothetical protein [Methylomonas sp.]MCK9608004.1 hypothetical protein [Methylomonas sp.]